MALFGARWLWHRPFNLSLVHLFGNAASFESSLIGSPLHWSRIARGRTFMRKAAMEASSWRYSVPAFLSLAAEATAVGTAHAGSFFGEAVGTA